MRKEWKFKVLIIALILLFGAVYGSYAGGLWNRGEHTIYAIWKLVDNARIDVKSGADIDVKSGGDIQVESGGEITFDSGGELTLTNATITGTGVISATHIADTTRSFPLDIAAGGVDGGNDLDEASTPDLTTCDGIPCIVWADSSETTAVGWTFRLPSDFVSGLTVYALISSNAASGSGQVLDWCVWVNNDGEDFDAACFAQTGVESTEAALNTKNDVLTLTSNASAEAAYVAGSWVTLEFFNASTDDDDLELKGLEVTYTATN